MSLFFTILDTVILGIRHAAVKSQIWMPPSFFTSMVILIIFFIAWLFSLTFLHLMVNEFTKNLHEKSQSHMKIHIKVTVRVVHWMITTAIMTLMDSRGFDREVNKSSTWCHDSFWLLQVLECESYSKQRSYNKQNFSRPNRTYTKLDLLQSRRIPRYYCI